MTTTTRTKSAKSGSPTKPARPAPPDDPLRHELDGLVYSLDAPIRRGSRGKNVVTIRSSGEDPGPGLTDRCDMMSFRSRRTLAQAVADSFGREAGQILGHLAVILDAAERALATAPCVAEVLSAERHKAAENLLGKKDLLDLAAQAMEFLGHVGEDRVKRIAYLIATSRLLSKPLSALLLAPSGTGKSAVLDAVSALMPPESVVTLARLTPMALFYSGPDALRHRLVVVDEFEGQAEAAHSVRVLQSRGELRQSVTIKGRAEEVVARGPVAVMSGTTLSEIDAQNTSRCVELALDDSLEQTKRIQAAQAASWSGAKRRPVDMQAWQDMQRVLGETTPMDVIIPFAPKLVFPSRTAADRRSSAKLLGLVAAHGLLFSRQRDRDREGRVIATVADYAAIHGLLQPVVMSSIDGLSPRASRAYALIVESGEPLTRREVADRCGWHYMTASRALDELEAQELVKALDKEVPRRWRLVGRGPVADAPALTAPEKIR